jgi:hypothetical protein
MRIMDFAWCGRLGKFENVLDKSLARREMVARASGPGEGCKDSSLHPSPGASRHPLPSGEGIAPKHLSNLDRMGL